jgi:hypothetical protein
MIELRYFILLLLFSTASISNAVDCNDWFKQNKVFPSDKNCVNTCVTLMADMDTYMCNLQCDKYCKLTCKNDPQWKTKIKEQRPINWNYKSELTKSWSKDEVEQLLKIFNILPDVFKLIHFDGIYRMEKSIQIVNPGTAQDSIIVLYDFAFSDPPFSLDHVLIHELAHVLFNDLAKSKRQSYNLAMGWKEKDGDIYRSGPFINSKAKDNPSEDFANNVEFLLLEPDLLKSKVPAAYDWLIKNYSQNFKLKERCKNEK